ncbi:MAG: DUF354 domain-containing protein [Opitutales bacterium]|nr:DUF354 domain-containing protein [Opitutales bacterium]
MARILIETHHPAHIHFWKYPIRELQNRGHEVLMIARDRDVMRRLLEVYDWIPHEIPPRPNQKNRFPLREMFSRQWYVAKAIRRFRPAVVASLMGSYTQSAKLLGVPNIIFTDSEFQHFNHRIAHPFADEIHTPECFYKPLGRRQRKYRSIHELAFLNERDFRPDPSVLMRYGLKGGAYIVVRLSAWNTLHDVKHRGLGESIRKFFKEHESQGPILLVAEEGKVPPGLESFRAEIAPEDFHGILALARFVLTEGASTASEAVCLGVPTVYVNSTEPRGYLNFLEKDTMLLKTFDEAAPGITEANDWLGRLQAASPPSDIGEREQFRSWLNARCEDLVAYVVKVVERSAGSPGKDDKYDPR